MPDTPQKSPTDLEWDPVYLHARKEAWLILGVWFLAMLWTLPVSYFNGFDSQVDIEQVTFIWGMPSWVFWGIGLPWMVANLITIWFCFVISRRMILNLPSQMKIPPIKKRRVTHDPDHPTRSGSIFDRTHCLSDLHISRVRVGGVLQLSFEE